MNSNHNSIISSYQQIVKFSKWLNQLFLDKGDYWKFSIPHSFGGQLSQKRSWARSEHYVRPHITEPPCFM